MSLLFFQFFFKLYDPKEKQKTKNKTKIRWLVKDYSHDVDEPIANFNCNFIIIYVFYKIAI